MNFVISLDIGHIFIHLCDHQSRLFCCRFSIITRESETAISFTIGIRHLDYRHIHRIYLIKQLWYFIKKYRKKIGLVVSDSLARISPDKISDVAEMSFRPGCQA